MTVQITSWVPAYAGGESVTLVAPNIPGSNIGGNFTAINDILIGTGIGTFTTATMGDILDGTYVPPSGPAGYSYNDLALPTASIDANNQFIINVLDPINSQDAATKAYVDLQVAGPGTFLPLAGGTMSGDILASGGVQIILDFGSASNPSLIFNGDPDTGIYRSAPDEISFTNAVAVGNPTFTIEADRTLNVAGTLDYELQVTSDDDIPNKKYVDDAIITIGNGAFLELIGGTMTGSIVFDAGQLFPFDETIENILAATDMQAAIDELSVTVDGVTGATYVNSFIGRTGVVVAATSDYDAIQVDYDPTASGLGVTNVQAAIDAIDSTIDGITGATYVNSFNTRTGSVVPVASDYDAIQVDFTPVGTISSTDVQGAIAELESDISGVITGGPYLPISGGSMTGAVVFLSAPTQLFPYDNSGTMITGTDMQAAITELDVRVDNIEIIIATGPFLELTGGTMSGQIDHGSLTAINLADPANPQDAATMNYVDTEIGNLGLVGTGPYLPLAGGAMTGLITGLPTLTVGDHVLGASDYQSGLGGNSFRITTSAAVTAAAPTYSFIGATDMGMYSSGTELRLAVGGADRITMRTGVNGDISVNTSKITDVADPTNDQDAVTKKWITDMTTVRLLGSVLSLDLTTGSGATFFTVPVGKAHMYTQLVIRARSYNPGASPTNPDITVGSSTSGGVNVLAQTTLDWGGIAGAADQAIVIPLGANGSPSSTPNPGDIIQITVPVPAGGTFPSAGLIVDVHLVGMEISS